LRQKRKKEYANHSFLPTKKQAMQAMAKSSNSKVIFLPGISQNQTVQSQLAQAEAAGEGPSRYGGQGQQGTMMTGGELGGYSYEVTGLANAANARNIENI